MLGLEDAHGWSYRYFHLNNDTPGTDDGAADPAYTVVPGIEPGVAVRAGQVLGWMGDSGNAENMSPHLHFMRHIPSSGRELRSCEPVHVPMGAPMSSSSALPPLAPGVGRQPGRSRRLAAGVSGALAVVVASLLLVPAWSSPAAADDAQWGVRPDEPPFRVVASPVPGASYTNDWHFGRSGGRLHKGNDLFAPKHTPVVAAAAGTVDWVRVEDSGNGGRMLSLKDPEGWSYRYFHLNNDTPGTDDNMADPRYTLAPGIKPGAKVKAGQLLGWLGDSGNAEDTAPHLHFEILQPDGVQVNPFPSLELSQGRSFGNLCQYGTNPEATPRGAAGRGYYVLDREGGIFAFGAVPFHGSVPGLRAAGLQVGMAAALDIATTPTGDGYLILDREGGIFAFGAVPFHGSVPQLRADGVTVGEADVVDLELAPDGDGYWMLDEEGGIFAFGSARYHGSVAEVRAWGGQAGRAVDLEPAPDGKGYWVLDEEGGIFSFGSARFHGSVPSLRAAGISVGLADVAGIGVTPDGKGYWVIDERGGVFAFGSAQFHGAVPGAGLCQWSRVTGIEPTATGKGYWMVSDNGRVWAFGDARYLGAVDTLPVPQVGAGSMAAATARPGS